jgi:hypothetical protein
MKLLIYKINNIPLNQLDYYNISDLNNNPAYIDIEDNDSIPNNYSDITSIKNWHIYSNNMSRDFNFFKLRIIELVNIIGWYNLTDEEKDIVIEYVAYDNDTDKVVYLMSNGYSMQDAQMFLLNTWHKHFQKNITCFKDRWMYCIKITMMFISRTDAEDLFETLDRLIYYYTDTGRLGKNFGDGNDGIMDYINSTNGFNGQGLAENGYQINNGGASAFIFVLNEILAQGKYNTNDL